MDSIDVAQSKANRQIPPLIHSSQTSPKVKGHIDESKYFLEELGINSQQFKTLFDNLPQAVAVYKMVYDGKGKPVDFIPLESNRVYSNLHSFKRERIGKKATEFNPKMKHDFLDLTGVYSRVATTGVPEHFEIYSKPDDKWYHCLLYTSPSPRDGLLSRMPSSA